jgi:hypothetical protein
MSAYAHEYVGGRHKSTVIARSEATKQSNRRGARYEWIASLRSQ